ncbi:hypothetical protein Tco_0507421 [Tanacetum coccineum]
MVTESLEHAVLAKKSSQPQSTYEVAASLTEFELIKSYDLDKSIFSTNDKVYSLKRSREDKDEDPSAGLDRGKSIQVEEPEFNVADSDMPHNQEGNLGNDVEEPMREVASICDWFTKPKQPQDPSYPNWNVGKTPQQGPTQSWLMTLAATADKPSKTFDELMSIPIDFSTEQRKTFYGYARGLESSHDVYSTKHIMAVTQVEGMQKHGYGYLREIEVRRADNELYTFKEGDFPRLRINDIEDMLILVVQNRQSNLSGNDVFNFAIALRMFTRSMVIQKRVKDL